MTKLNQNNQPESPHWWFEVLITTLFWGVWLYVVMPILSLILWIAGYQVFVEQMITLGGYETFLEKVNTYGLVVLLIMVATIIWVNWNLRHYGHHNTRTHMIADVTLAESAAVAGVDVAKLQQIQTTRRIVIEYDERDYLVQIEKDTQSRTVAST